MIYPVFFSVTLFGIYAHAKLTLFSAVARVDPRVGRSEEHTSELQSPCNLVCRLLLEKKKKNIRIITSKRTCQRFRFIQHDHLYTLTYILVHDVDRWIHIRALSTTTPSAASCRTICIS